MTIKAVLFDMDGVLVDTEELICLAAIEALKKYGVNAVPDDFTEYVGAGETRYIGGPAEKYGVKFVPEMKTEAYAIYEKLLKERPEAVYPGTLDVIKYVKERYRAAVCSAADYAKVKINLNAIGVDDSFFGALVTGSDIKRLKPAPDIFLTGAGKLDTDPEYCVVIEDSINGIKAAKAAGMMSVAVMTYFDRETLEGIGPDLIIKDISEFPSALEKLSKM